MTPIIETTNLSRRYGRTEAVRDLTLQVPEGSLFAFVGPNGAGKTTTIKTVMNLVSPSSGGATVLGVDARRLTPREFQQIGYVSEDQEIPAWMTLRQLLAYCAPLYPTWDAAFCEQLRLQLDLPLDRRLKTFSRGMRMKAALLSSLAYRPRLLVLDEPFAGLDALVRDELVAGVLELAEQSQWTVFISSHDIDEVERLADWIGIINEGRLHLAEPVSSLLERCRQVEATFEGEAPLPAAPADGWLDVEASGRVLRLVDTACNGLDDEARIARQLPGVGHVTLSPMSLKGIFVAMARGFRSAEGRSPQPLRLGGGQNAAAEGPR